MLGHRPENRRIIDPSGKCTTIILINGNNIKLTADDSQINESLKIHQRSLTLLWGLIQRHTMVQGANYKNVQDAPPKNETSVSHPFLPTFRQHCRSGQKDYEPEIMDEYMEILSSGHNRKAENTSDSRYEKDDIL